MKKQKLWFFMATFMGFATLAPVLVNAQSAMLNAQINGNVDGRMNGRGMKPGAVGKVTAVSGNTITINQEMRGRATTTTYNTKIITIDATNAAVIKNNATSSVSAIAVGDSVFAEGILTGTNLVATKIHDGQMFQGKGGIGGAMAQMQGNGQPIVAGNISLISGNTITITNKSNVSYSIDATNAKVIVKNATSSISGLLSGDIIVAQGTVNGNVVVATTIIDQGTPTATNGQNRGQEEGFGKVMQRGGELHSGFLGGIKNFFSHIFGF